MSARSFLENVVEPDAAALNENYGDERTAYHAVHSVDALAAHIFADLLAKGHSFAEGVVDDTAFRHHLAEGNQDFALLRDVAKALKHVSLTRGSPAVSRAEQISTKRLGFDEGRWDEARYDGPPQVVLETDAGDLRPIETVAKRSIEYLKDVMQQHSLM